MAESVLDKIGWNAIDHGLLLGQSTPSEETEYSFFKVFLWGNRIIACTFDHSNIAPPSFVMAEEITPKELPLYVDNEEDAFLFLHRNLVDYSRANYDLLPMWLRYLWDTKPAYAREAEKLLNSFTQRGI